MNQFAKDRLVTLDFVNHLVACDVQGSRHLLSFGYDDHLSSGPEIQEEEREANSGYTGSTGYLEQKILKISEQLT